MSVNGPLSYEAAFLAEDVTAIADKIIEIVNERIGPLTDEPLESCIVAAAMMSAAQEIDGGCYKDRGATGALARLVASMVLHKRS